MLCAPLLCCCGVLFRLSLLLLLDGSYRYNNSLILLSLLSRCRVCCGVFFFMFLSLWMSLYKKAMLHYIIAAAVLAVVLRQQQLTVVLLRQQQQPLALCFIVVFFVGCRASLFVVVFAHSRSLRSAGYRQRQ